MIYQVWSLNCKDEKKERKKVWKVFGFWREKFVGTLIHSVWENHNLKFLPCWTITRPASWPNTDHYLDSYFSCTSKIQFWLHLEMSVMTILKQSILMRRQSNGCSMCVQVPDCGAGHRLHPGVQHWFQQVAPWVPGQIHIMQLTNQLNRLPSLSAVPEGKADVRFKMPGVTSWVLQGNLWNTGTKWDNRNLWLHITWAIHWSLWDKFRWEPWWYLKRTRFL